MEVGDEQRVRSRRWDPGPVSYNKPMTVLSRVYHRFAGRFPDAIAVLGDRHQQYVNRRRFGRADPYLQVRG